MGIKVSAVIFATAAFVFLPVISLAAQMAPVAQGSTPANQNMVLTSVATVNILDLQIVKQSGNVLTLGFDVSNREGFQPSIVYAVELYQKDRDGKFVLSDEKVYESDIFGLGKNETVHKTVSFTASSYLKGPFTLQVEARNPEGLILSSVKAPSDVVFNGTGEYIRIDQPQCYLTIDGEKANTHYTLSQGVDVSSNEKLVAHCSLTNTSKNAMTVTPVFQAH